MIRSAKIFCFLFVTCSEILSVLSYENRLSSLSISTIWNRRKTTVGNDGLDRRNFQLQHSRVEDFADVTAKTMHKILPALILSGLICGICDLTPLREFLSLATQSARNKYLLILMINHFSSCRNSKCSCHDEV